jgi:hypothetical protein
MIRTGHKRISGFFRGYAMNSNREEILRRSIAVIIFAILLALPAASVLATDEAGGYQPAVSELIDLLDSRPDLQASLEGAVSRADLQGIGDVPAFLAYVDDLITLVPTEREVVPECLKFYYIVNQASDDYLNNDEQFSEWMKRLVRAWGSFLDTPASAAGIATFMEAKNYNIDDYIQGPSGWQTFNQFFAREVKSGRRPIAEPRNDKVVVSPADTAVRTRTHSVAESIRTASSTSMTIIAITFPWPGP